MYGVGVCVNVCGVVCVVVCCCVLRLGVACCVVVGVWGVVIYVLFLLFVMRVVGGVPLWVMLCVYVCCAPSFYSGCGILCYL